MGSCSGFFRLRRCQVPPGADKTKCPTHLTPLQPACVWSVDLPAGAPPPRQALPHTHTTPDTTQPDVRSTQLGPEPTEAKSHAFSSRGLVSPCLPHTPRP